MVLVYPPAEKTARITLQEVRRCANEGIHLASFALIEDYFYWTRSTSSNKWPGSGGVAAYCNAETWAT
ncbi:MAG: hypothetical protein Ct9H300mP1_05860 [Planctomycetaceae bacterium]|nr:MAG: hypothetical protein Ct9H300mP1_05860 [Planctomycetaceae bacterium]